MAILEDPVTPEEVAGVIKTLKNSKLPGTDGYGTEFYKAFSHHLVDTLSQTFNEVLTTGSFPPSWNEATIVVLPKKDRDPLETKSYRPISLLNQDYKIFTAILKKCLNQIIGSYIHQDESGFVPNRDITDNVYRMLELIHYGRLHRQQTSLILSLDIEKSFDRVEHPFLLSLLDHMGFGMKFTTALKTISMSPITKVKVNGCS